MSPPSRLGRDLVTFECPIKRRGSVRAPLWVPFRHVTDERAAIFPANHTHTRIRTHSSHPLILFHAYFPRLFCLVLAQTHSPPWLKIPRRSDCSLPLEQEVTTVWSMAAEPIASYTPGPGCCLLTGGVLPLRLRGCEGPVFCCFWWKIKHCFLKLARKTWSINIKEKYSLSARSTVRSLSPRLNNY